MKFKFSILLLFAVLLIQSCIPNEVPEDISSSLIYDEVLIDDFNHVVDFIESLTGKLTVDELNFERLSLDGQNYNFDYINEIIQNSKYTSSEEFIRDHQRLVFALHTFGRKYQREVDLIMSAQNGENFIESLYSSVSTLRCCSCKRMECERKAAARWVLEGTSCLGTLEILPLFFICEAAMIWNYAERAQECLEEEKECNQQ